MRSSENILTTNRLHAGNITHPRILNQISPIAAIIYQRDGGEHLPIYSKHCW